jgi:nucleoside-diphosphate-sugar epimerase
VRILVVGASGFVGGYLVKQLSEQGDEVDGWGRETAPSTRHLSSYQAVDLLRPETLPAPAASWDAAVLLAGHSVPGGFTDVQALENVAMGVHALGYLAKYAAGIRVLLVSSAHVYPPAPHPLGEDEVPVPQGRYGTSRLLLETWVKFAPLELDVHVVRMFNQVGPGMPSGLLATDLLRRLKAGEDPVILRTPDHVRDFTDVRDGAIALASLLRARLEFRTVVNLCSGRGTRISDLARCLADALGRNHDFRFSEGTANHLVGDPRKLKELINWQPARSLATSLSDLVTSQSG